MTLEKHGWLLEYTVQVTPERLQPAKLMLELSALECTTKPGSAMSLCAQDCHIVRWWLHSADTRRRSTTFPGCRSKRKQMPDTVTCNARDFQHLPRKDHRDFQHLPRKDHCDFQHLPRKDYRDFQHLPRKECQHLPRKHQHDLGYSGVVIST